MQPGTPLNHYEILSAIGKGGMGEVWRARDTKLGREVAIKTLPEEFERDAERLARFEREAKVLASLNHPNIAAIHGFEQDKGRHFLVLELVPGDTLADRLQAGPIPVDESIRLALQIAQALEAAHEKGVIHRDLKPANIKVTDEGKVKVLDFGLAKAFSGEESSVNLSNSPTLSMAATQQGLILGTAAYMSPEQARGKTVDKRTDIWAFGCVLYEMLTGRQAFEGEDISDTLANVLKKTPDLNALPAGVPASVRAALSKCLEKDRQQRMADISVAQFLLGEQNHVPPVQVAPRVPLWRRLAVYGLPGLLVGTVVAGEAVWLAMRPASPHVIRTTITAPSTVALSFRGFGFRILAVTPDGTRLVWIGPDASQLVVRTLDQLDPILIKGLNQVRDVFLSPDGQWIGFFEGENIRRVAITGGQPPLPIGQSPDAGTRGATWGEDGTIIFANGNPSEGLLAVPATGGQPVVLTTPNHAAGEYDHLWPRFLPGGKAVLFTITSTRGEIDNSIAVLDLRTHKYKPILPGGSDAHYVPSGHLVYGTGATLAAVAFDLDRLEPVGTPVSVIPQVNSSAQGSFTFDVSRDGTLVYAPRGGGGGDLLGRRTLLWVDRQGHEVPLSAEPMTYQYPRLSPDGTHLAVDARDRQQDIWIWNFSPGTLSRFTTEGGLDAFPVWTHKDPLRLVFSSGRAGSRNLFWQSAKGTAGAENLTQSSNDQDPLAVTEDDTQLIFKERFGKTGWDLMLLTLNKPKEVKPLVHTMANEVGAELSPDGRWLAYQSDETGKYEIYVRPFPDVDSNRWLISTGGGTMPLWSRRGEELFYLAPSGVLMRVDIPRASGFNPGPPQKLMDWPYFSGSAVNLGRTYDISLDGRRFLAIKENTVPPQTASTDVTVVQNWFEELKKLVPVR